MQKTIGMTDLHEHLPDVLDEVMQNNVPYILTRESHPEIALIPYQDFLRFQAWQEQAILERFDRLMDRMAALNAVFDEEEMADDIEAARHERR